MNHILFLLPFIFGAGVPVEFFLKPFSKIASTHILSMVLWDSISAFECGN